jgi:RNA polymerase sigma-70 factor, ECF subfamily
LNEKYSNGELFILKKMIDGDIHSFKYFFDKYYTDLCNFVHIYLNDKDLSEEIVQDIFVYFWENKEKLKISTSVKSYLYAASKFKGLNLLRDTKNHKRIIEKIEKYNHENIYEEDELYLDVAEFKKVIETAVDQLAPKCREIFLLSKQHELTNREIAEKLGISVKTVENQMTIALKKLREHLLPFRGKIFELFLVFFISLNSF